MTEEEDSQVVGFWVAEDACVEVEGRRNKV